MNFTLNDTDTPDFQQHRWMSEWIDRLKSEPNLENESASKSLVISRPDWVAIEEMVSNDELYERCDCVPTNAREWKALAEEYDRVASVLESGEYTQIVSVLSSARSQNFKHSLYELICDLSSDQAERWIGLGFSKHLFDVKTFISFPSIRRVVAAGSIWRICISDVPYVREFRQTRDK